MIEITCLAIVFIQGILIVLAYRQGLKDGRRVDQDRDLQPIANPAKCRSRKEAYEYKRADTIMKNIENYGTKIPQEKVK